ncbi:MAG: hypothetical protein ABSH49_31915 [Bryobacteraceae bacterium]
MYNHVRRIAKLEKQFGTVESESPLLLVVSRIGCPLALDEDRCVEILGESGFLPRGPAMGVVNLGRMPKGPPPLPLRRVRDGCARDLELSNRGNNHARAPGVRSVQQAGIANDIA